MNCQVYDIVLDRKGRVIGPGDRVRIRLYPRGTAEGTVAVSSKTKVVSGGILLSALVVEANGAFYSMPGSKHILKLGA
jgi:hypothetical protein